MPWNGSGSYSFNSTTVAMQAPASSGVYALFNQNQWVYFGESENIRDRLLQHLKDGTNPCVARARPQLFAYQTVYGLQARIARQDALIREFWHLGLCNKRLG